MISALSSRRCKYHDMWQITQILRETARLQCPSKREIHRRRRRGGLGIREQPLRLHSLPFHRGIRQGCFQSGKKGLQVNPPLNYPHQLEPSLSGA